MIKNKAHEKHVLHECSAITCGLIAFLHAQGKVQNDPQMQNQARETAKAVVRYFFGLQIH